jgi:hypothetical protein
VDDGALDVVAGEAVDHVQRVPPRRDDDLDSAPKLALKQSRATIIGNSGQLRQNHVPE